MHAKRAHFARGALRISIRRYVCIASLLTRLYDAGSVGQLTHSYRVPFIPIPHALQLVRWSSFTPATMRDCSAGLLLPMADAAAPPAYTVPSVGDGDRALRDSAELCAATVPESCSIHLDRARRETASTSAVGIGTGICNFSSIAIERREEQDKCGRTFIMM
jgi:hypothetical protein